MGVEPICSVYRYCSDTKRKEPVNCPAVIKSYNANMGGIYKSDMLVHLYCTPMKFKRWLSGCMVTQKGCHCLSSALSSNLSRLRELDLSYNHPGDSGVKQLSKKLKDQNCSLYKLNVDYGGESRLRAGLKKYACFLTLDPNTANTQLILSEGNRKSQRVTVLDTRWKQGERQTQSQFPLISNSALTKQATGDSGVKLRSALLNDPHCKLKKLLI
ncbi:hypothetical protein QQF64_018561 [Cirrhinus molitorella]|uniref:Uncharacterized protein n=1 Tax=Cirrhinus molitorella TaxID=172907 RepID=A0ABR3LEI6_9TELE